MNETPVRSAGSGAGAPAGGPGGFTLIELLVILVLLGICGGYVIVNYTGVTGRERVRSAARILDGHYRSLRRAAVDLGLDVNAPIQAMLQLDLPLWRFRSIVPPRQDDAGRYVLDDEIYERADVEALLDRTPWRHLPTGVVLDRIWTGPSAGYERANLKEVVNIIFWANGTVDHHILVYRAGEHVMSAEVNPQTASAEFHEGEHRLPDVKASHFRTLRMGS